jgi:hypothetical protein
MHLPGEVGLAFEDLPLALDLILQVRDLLGRDAEHLGIDRRAQHQARADDPVRLGLDGAERQRMVALEVAAAAAQDLEPRQDVAAGLPSPGRQPRVRRLSRAPAS